MKKFLSMMLIFCLILAMIPIHAFAGKKDVIKNDKTGIPDKALYRVILAQLGRKKGLITRKEAESIKVINSVDYYYETNIKSLKGISNFPNLKALYIHGNKGLTSLKELQNLRKPSELENIVVPSCGIKSLSGVEKFNNLTSLIFTDNKIKNIDNIKELTNLREISFAGNKLEKLPDLTKLINLEEAHPDGYGFAFNKLKKSEFNKKLPAHFVNSYLYGQWLDKQLQYQNVSRFLKFTSIKGKKIKNNITKIKGKTVKYSYLFIYEGENQSGELIKSIRADGKGKFTFKNLNLKKYKGKKICVESYKYGCRMGKLIYKII